MSAKELHLAVSGTYSTGKTTTTEALSLATGIPRTHAMTAREILVDLVPGKQMMDLSAMELMAIGLRRMEERIHHEAVAIGASGSFVCDGSIIHEWVYGEVRMRVGINPGAGPLHRAVKELAGLPIKRFYQQYMDAYGAVAKQRATRIYDAYIHLPVEFEMRKDGHRPVSEKFRSASDDLLLETLDEMSIPYHIVKGSIADRVAQVIDLFDLPTVRPLDEAVDLAVRRTAEATRILEEDDRHHANQRAASPWRRLKYAMRY